jgi:hypothetical protein
MDDIKLLELAGLAAGEKFGPNNNPLERDDLALRLAVKLGIEVHDQYQYSLAGATVRVPFREFFEDINGDPYAATRRAIVRAAAALADGEGGNG